MKKNIKLSRIHCVGCAENLESKILELEGVNKASVDFVKRVVSVDVVDKSIIEKVEACIVKFDSSIKIIDNSEEEKQEKRDRIKRIFDIIRIGCTILFTLLGVFLPNSVTWLKISFYGLAYLLIGYEIIIAALKNIIKGKVLDENFLMTIATVGALVLTEYIEAIAVMLLYTVGEFLQGLAVAKSKKRVKSLLDIKADVANLVLDSGEIAVELSKVKVGDFIRIKAGEKVPLDCVVIEGKSSLNTAAITGESKESYVEKGSELLSGSINIDGVLLCKVVKNEKDSTVSKVIDLVEKASKNKASTERFITKFAKWYTPMVVGVAIGLAVVPYLLGFNFNTWLYRALTFLVVSCPCALVISIPLGYFAGIGVAAKNGVLIKGANFIELLAKADTVIFDKTGTLTYGEFEVEKVYAESCSSEEEVLELIAYAESFSNHRIAKSIVKAYKKNINIAWVEGYQEVAGLGVKATLFMEECLVGNLKFLRENNIDVKECEDAGTVVYLAKSGVYLGYVLVSDKVKESSFEAVNNLKKCGINHVTMFTGDNEKIAKSVADKLNLDSFYANLLPKDKVEALNSFKENRLIFVGDGINDAPAIASVDVGVSMGGVGSDAAVEISDVVLMNDDPKNLEKAIKISKKVTKIINQNVVFILILKLVVMLLTFFGLSGMWLAIFADVGVALLAVLNSLRVMIPHKKRNKNNKKITD